MILWRLIGTRLKTCRPIFPAIIPYPSEMKLQTIHTILFKDLFQQIPIENDSFKIVCREILVFKVEMQCLILKCGQGAFLLQGSLLILTTRILVNFWFLSIFLYFPRPRRPRKISKNIYRLSRP